jgi:type IV secretory pathway protease TraF
MHANEPSEYLNVIHRLKKEIDLLAQEQIEAMKTATFIGLTADEAKEYEDRRGRILELVKQLRVLEEAA